MSENCKVMQIIPNLGVAGAEIMLENLAISLESNGMEVKVVSLYNEKSPITCRLDEHNIPLYYLNKKKGIDLKILFSLYKLMIAEKPDVIHTHRYALQYTIPAAIFARIPIRIHTVHNVAEKEVGRLQRKLHNIFYKFCKVVPVSISPLVKKSVEREYRLPEKQLPMIYNGINLDKCKPKDIYKESIEKIVILHIGRQSIQKNHIGLLEAFKIVHDNMPNTELKLIGTGELRESILDKIGDLGLQDCVELLGLKDNVSPYLHNADIFVLPSLWEGMPITLIEAMATGLPIVATEVGGIPDMISNNISGLLTDTNPENIAEALLKLTRDPELREKLGRTARDTSKRFSAQQMAEAYTKLYFQ